MLFFFILNTFYNTVQQQYFKIQFLFLGLKIVELILWLKKINN